MAAWATVRGGKGPVSCEYGISLTVVVDIVDVVWGITVVDLIVVEGGGVVVSASTAGAVIVVLFKVCRANNKRLVIDRFKRGRVTINRLAIRRDLQQHKPLLTQW